ncbi:MAG TPA: carboxypeptidase-like regulatory domain-containing protein, partial [Terriglobales bacterium]|nr:carboxypeptidase-like regulatory domain-containing protein [Terriglobales bacterium]
MQCPLKKEGALWIHVTDDLGRSIPKLLAGKSATEMVKTNKAGLAIFDPLPEKPYEATLGELTSPDFDLYERPENDKKEVPVSNGSISYVSFELRRKATLNVEVYYKRDPKRFLSLPKEPFTDAALTLEGQRTAGGVAHALKGDTPGGKKKFELVPAGTYEVTAKLPGKFATTHELVEEKATVTLDPGGAETIVFEVEPIYQTVQMVAHCLMTLPKYLFHDGKWMLKYNGDPDDSQDRIKRVALLKYVIEEAQKLPAVNKDRTNLKIFLVPECFFLGKYGGYEWSAIGDLVKLLQELVKDIEWRDWLFVFGTVNGMMASGDVTEMFNLSPVIRGGHDGVEADTYTQLMQKNVYSAEMPSRAELIPETGLSRTQHVSDDVQFHGTENEVKLGKAMEKMLADPTTKDLFTREGLTEAQWLLLKSDLDEQVKSIGMPRVIRPLRICDLPVVRVMVDQVAVGTGKKTSVPVDTPVDLKTLQFAGFAKGKLQETASYSGWEPAAVFCLKQKFPGFTKVKFSNDTATRGKALQEAKDNAEALLGEYGVDNNFQLQAFKAAILAMDDMQALEVMAKTGDLVDTPSPVPFIRKLLEMYIAEKKLDAPSVTRLDTDFDFRDYALTIKRTVSGIIPARDVDTVPAPKRINIGVEICADHSNARLRKSLAKSRDTLDKPVKTLPPPVIDLQLVPSCGMYPVEDAVSVRTDGYIFNCD